MINLCKLIQESMTKSLFDSYTNLFITSDTHFNHKGIIKYCNRPFKDIEEMNEVLINNWNYIVDPEDIVLHLGDFGFGGKPQLQPIRERLNGTILLLMGNHDKRNTLKFWDAIGIDYIYKKPIESFDLLFSHEPIDCYTDTINIHGHIHHKTLQDKFNFKNHINVSTDVTGFYPVNISTILMGEEE